MLYKQYAAMERGDYEATARQFYTANASLARRQLLDAGGFDDVVPAGRGRRAGVPARRPRAAVHVRPRRRGAAPRRAQLRRRGCDIARQYGRNDVIFGRDHGQAWLLDSIATEFHGRHRLVRGADPDAASPAPAAPRRVDRRSRWSPVARARCGVGAVDRAGAERALQPRLLRRHGRRARRSAAHARRCSTQRRRRRCAVRPRDRRSCSSRRSATSPTPPTCSTSSAPTTIDAVFDPIEFDVDGLRARGPGLRQLDRPRRRPRPAGPSAGCDDDGPLDAMFIHTQVPAILVARPRAPHPDRRVARRHADPVRRAGRALRPRHRRAAGRAAEVAGQPRLLRPRRSHRRRGRSGPSRASSTATRCRPTRSS